MSKVIRVWRVQLKPDIAPDAGEWLPLDEREREIATQFRQSADCYRYVRSHAALRRILGSETGQSAEALQFLVTSYGKPVLANSVTQVQFNLSHCADWALVAVCHDAAVGVDIEYQKPINDLGVLVEYVCMPLERQLILAAPDPMLAFYRCWVVKEAVLKCTGRGLGISPKSFTAFDAQGEVLSLLTVPTEFRTTSRVAVRLIDALPVGYVGAVAIASGNAIGQEFPQIELMDVAD